MHSHTGSASPALLLDTHEQLDVQDRAPLPCAGHSGTAVSGSNWTAHRAENWNSSLRYTMDWRAQRPLHWDDFQGHPKPETGVDAVSSCGIRCDPELRRDGTLRFEVNAYFSHHDSWVDAGDANNYLLEHEQRHFDLAELYARKLRKELQATAFERGKINTQIQQTYDRMFRAYKKAQKTYDAESAHSTDLEAQQRWDRWIADELYRYRHWAGSTVQGKVKR
jgi:hypothetical protein